MGAISQYSIHDHLFHYIDFDTDYTPLLKASFGKFAKQISTIFPDKLGSIAITTRKERRNIWRAALARTVLTDQTDLEALRHAFMFASAKSLLLDAYESLPTGFLRLIRTKSADLGVAGFNDLHTLLCNGTDAFALHGTELTDDLLANLIALPWPFNTVAIAKQFISKSHYQAFQKAAERLERYGIPDGLREALSHVSRGMRPHNALTEIYQGVSFPEPLLVAPNLVYIANIRHMQSVAQIFENCLANYVDEALQGSQQFYIWTDPEGDILFSIKCITSSLYRLDQYERRECAFLLLEEVPAFVAFMTDNGIMTDPHDTPYLIHNVKDHYRKGVQERQG